MLDGTLNVTVPSAKVVEVLHADDYAFIPADSQHVLSSDNGAGLLLFERRCVVSGQYSSLHRSITRISIRALPIQICEDWQCGHYTCASW